MIPYKNISTAGARHSLCRQYSVQPASLVSQILPNSRLKRSPEPIPTNDELQGLRIVIRGRQYWFVVYYLALGYGKQTINMTMDIWAKNQFFLVFKIGAKASIAPVFAAEAAAEHLRGRLLMMWQLFDTL